MKVSSSRSTNVNSIFKDRLNKLMSDRKITQEKLEEKTGIKRSTIAGYTAGKSRPNFEKLVIIANTFNVSVDYLLGRTTSQTIDMEVRAISDYTGLPEDTVEDLSFYKEEFENIYPAFFDSRFYVLLDLIKSQKNAVDLLNTLLNATPETIDELAKSIYLAGHDLSVEDYSSELSRFGHEFSKDNYNAERRRTLLQYQKSQLELQDYHLSKSLSAWIDVICHASTALDKAREEILNSRNSLT